MFDNDERLGWADQISDGAIANARVEADAAHRMINDFVGSATCRRVSPCEPFAHRFLARPFAQTRHPRRLRQPIARRRLAAVRAVNPSRRSSSAICALEPRSRLPAPRPTRSVLPARVRPPNQHSSNPEMKADSRVQPIYTLGSPESLRQPGQLRVLGSKTLPSISFSRPTIAWVKCRGFADRFECGVGRA